MKFFGLLFSFTIMIVNAKSPFQRKQIDSIINITNKRNAYSDLGDKEMLRLATEAYYLSKEEGYDKGRLESLIKFLEIYFNTNNINGVSDKSEETIVLAKKMDDHYILSRALRYNAWMYIKIGKYNLARCKLEEATRVCSGIVDSDKRNKILMNINSTMASYYEASASDTESMLLYAFNAYRYAAAIKNSNPDKRKYLSATATVVGHILLYKGDLKRAKIYILNAEQNLINDPDKATLVKIYKALGIIAMKEREYIRAADYYKKAVFFAKKYNQNDELKNIYPMLSAAYEASDDYKNALNIYNQYKRITDSLTFETRKVINKTKDIQSKKDENLDSFDYSIFGICLAMLMLYSKRKTGIKNPRKTKIITESKGEPEVFHTKTEQLNQLTELAIENEQAFYTMFQEIYPHFIENMLAKYPKLSTADLRLCAYLKMNFDTKQIASFTNSTIRSVDAKKYRLRKKLDIKPDEELYSFIAIF
ncbi:hypothetical protein DRF59_11325 [Chryseobacterium flavum]|uniref:Uncharacterized protein n=1 Tax=Chryseobacterium flavum TaxID=415851 RepID=A0A3D9CMF0_9FLAO|nr:hypothetical protein [Chryseobacterium flavum]REC66887.1 hypothetical protein DRF59_11325 [Chryseobacterium flavum]